MNNIEFSSLLKEAEVDRAEAIKLEIAFKLDQALISQAISRTALAKKMGTSPAWITKVLRGDVNLTLETMVKLTIAAELDLHIAITQKPKVTSSATIFHLPSFKNKPEKRGASEAIFNTKQYNINCNDLAYEDHAA